MIENTFKMDEIAGSNHEIIMSRLGDCEVCGGKEAKYTCPACLVRTCSLSCVTVHKKELNCTGVRNKVKFKHLSAFTDMDLQSDYMLLEEVGRSVENIIKRRKPFQKNLSFKCQKLKSHLWHSGIRLHFLPPTFNKHMENTTYLNWQTGVVFWRVEWMFPQAICSDKKAVDDRVDETNLVSDLVQKYLSTGSTPAHLSESLTPYMTDSTGLDHVRVLMKAEKVCGGPKYFLISPNLSLGENLQGKLIIEHPTFYIVLYSQISQYNIVTPESICSRENPRRHKISPSAKGGVMKFFSDNLSDSDNEV